MHYKVHGISRQFVWTKCLFKQNKIISKNMWTTFLNNEFISSLQIINSDLHNPHGLSVDWISNNIYFSHISGSGHGRIEVAKCDGSRRKVLKHNLRSVGVLAVNPITGYVTIEMNNCVVVVAWIILC